MVSFFPGAATAAVLRVAIFLETGFLTAFLGMGFAFIGAFFTAFFLAGFFLSAIGTPFPFEFRSLNRPAAGRGAGDALALDAAFAGFWYFFRMVSTLRTVVWPK